MLAVQFSLQQTIARDVNRWRAEANGQLAFGVARAVTQSAAEGRKDAQAEMKRVFDRPTPWIVNSVRYQMADKAAVRYGLENVQARVFIVDEGNKGISPRQALAAQLTGGARSMKRFESAFVRLGLLTNGESLVPASGRSDVLDQYGNVRAALLVQLLSYFQAFGEQGYRANTTLRRRTAIARYGRSERGFRTIGGKVYFWSRGPGHWSGAGSWQQGRAQHLARGIWEKSGTHGVNVKPVLLAVKGARYTKRYDFVGTVQRSVQRTFPNNLARSLREAGGTST